MVAKWAKMAVILTKVDHMGGGVCGSSGAKTYRVIYQIERHKALNNMKLI